MRARMLLLWVPWLKRRLKASADRHTSSDRYIFVVAAMKDEAWGMGASRHLCIIECFAGQWIAKQEVWLDKFRLVD